MPTRRRQSDIDLVAETLNLSRRLVTRYAQGGKLDRFTGWVGKVVDFITGGGRGARRSVRRSEVPPEVWRQLGQLADRVSGISTAPPPPAPLGRRPPPAPPGSPGPGRQPLPPPGTGSKFELRREPPLPGEEPSYGREILVSNSSNVYSFSYDSESSTLYVTYLAPAVNSKAVSRGRVKRGKRMGREQMVGELGKTLKGKSNSRGPLYSYFDVPARVFERMKLATSKGKFVWSELRIRGSIFGHKYRYALVQGAVITQAGVSGTYIPRKATRTGFRSRSVADVGRSSRGFQTSTLSSQEGFRTRSAPRR